MNAPQPGTLAGVLSQPPRDIGFNLGARGTLLQQGSLAQVGLPGPTPLVSCLMVSRGQLFPSRFAIDCFRRQSYEPRELVIVCDGPGTPLEQHCRQLGDQRIRFVYPGAPASSLGQLRNLSLSAARGEWVCQWDDDDLYHPRRIEIGMAMCLSMQVDALFLTRWLLWSPLQRRLGISGVRAWEGSMIARRDAVVPYPALARGEDTPVAQAMIATLRVLLADAPWLYTYIQTGVNTWPGQHFARLLKEASHLEPEAGYELALQAGDRIFSYQAYARAVQGGSPMPAPAG